MNNYAKHLKSKIVPTCGFSNSYFCHFLLTMTDVPNWLNILHNARIIDTKPSLPNIDYFYWSYYWARKLSIRQLFNSCNYTRAKSESAQLSPCIDHFVYCHLINLLANGSFNHLTIKEFEDMLCCSVVAKHFD